MTALIRVPIQIPGAEMNLDPIMLDVANQAKAKLGYQVLKQEVVRSHGPQQLARALAELEIEPFSDESVQTYQQERLDEARGPKPVNSMSWLRREMGPLGALLLMGGFFGAILAGQVLCLIGIPLGIALLCWSLEGVGALENWKGWGWKMDEINTYPAPVPEYVLAKALQIKDRLPEVQIFVSHLIKEEQRMDPFLVVRYGPAQYYVEVWDEPKFEGRL